MGFEAKPKDDLFSAYGRFRDVSDLSLAMQDVMADALRIRTECRNTRTALATIRTSLANLGRYMDAQRPKSLSRIFHMEV